jgi:hypothetical protein
MSALFQAFYFVIEAAMLRLWASVKAWSFSKSQSDARYWQKAEEVVATTLSAPARLAIVNEVEADADLKIKSLGDSVFTSLGGKLGIGSTAANADQLGGITLTALMNQISGQITTATNQVLQTAKNAFAQGAKDFGLVIIESSNNVETMTFDAFFTAAFGPIIVGAWNDGPYHAQLLLKAVNVSRELEVTMPNGSTQKLNNLDSLVFNVTDNAITSVTFVDDPIVELIANNKTEIATERVRIDTIVDGFTGIIAQMNALNFT